MANITFIKFLPLVVFIAQVLVGLGKQLKHNIFKNNNWSEANQVAIYKLEGWKKQLGLSGIFP